ncbi:ABC transporter ATP-binding protein [bacterium]|nr:ABC transporter ATP-binding protein [bacterium]
MSRRNFHEEESLAKHYDAELMRRLLAYARPHARTLALCVGLLAFLSAAQLAQPYLVKLAIDQVILPADKLPIAERGEAIAKLWWLVGTYGALLVSSFGVSYWQTWLLQSTGQRIIYRIRQDVFAHLQRLSLAYFDANPVGRLVTRVTNDTETLNEMYTSVLVNLFRDCFSIVGILGMLFYLDARLAWVTCAVVPVVVLVVAFFRKLARENFREHRTRLARVNAFIAENLSGMRTIQIFNREKRQLDDFRAVNASYFEATWGHLQIFAVFRPALDLLAALALALVLWQGGLLSAHGALQLGTLYAFTSYVRQLFQPINELAEKFNLLQSAMASSERIFQLLDTQSDIQDSPEALPLPGLVGGVEFERVHFAYEEGVPILKDVNFSIKPGETVAFVGHTGAGKSSILSLLARFYDVQQGNVRLDGHDVRALPQATLRRGIGFVLQDVFLFASDIRSNIRLNDPTITDAQVEEAARAVGAEAFIRQLPQGYDTVLSERGTTLSTGQRQLLAFARALAFDPAILVLDEATANIDSETEAVIQEALARLCAGRTTLIVAHRLSTIQHADRIVVLHKGEVREVGTHAELLKREGLYHKLWRLQFEALEAHPAERA